MAVIIREKLVPQMDAYKRYLDAQKHDENSRPLSNTLEDYKRGIARKAYEILDSERWSKDEIGNGTIGEKAIKAVQKNYNLIGRFQVSAFADKVREDVPTAEKVLFDLYHDHKEQECFEQICNLFGRKYDLVAYLYFIIDCTRYLPLRSSIFDGVFKRLDINLQTAGRCSWNNYQEFLNTIEEVRDLMREHFLIDDIDLLDAHSFLWTLNMDVLDAVESSKEKKAQIGASVEHRDYGMGTISKMTDENVYVTFAGGMRIFPFPAAFEKGYLTL